MQKIERVRCPNCGNLAERHHLFSSRLTRTQCGACDYLMVMCAATGKVLEAYAPGIYAPAPVPTPTHLCNFYSLRG